MEDLFKKFSPFNLVMIILSIFAIIAFVVDGEWISAIWAFNTLCWVLISTSNEITIKDLRKENSDLLSELMRIKGLRSED